MLQNNNSDLTKELREGGRLQEAIGVQSLITDHIIPVMEVNPKALRQSTFVKSTIVANSTGGNIFITDANVDTYITGVNLSVVKDATATSTNTQITVIPFGTASAITLIRLPHITLNAEIHNIVMTFPPLKLKRGSAVGISTGTANANINYTGGVIGFTVETPNA